MRLESVFVRLIPLGLAAQLLGCSPSVEELSRARPATIAAAGIGGGSGASSGGSSPVELNPLLTLGGRDSDPTPGCVPKGINSDGDADGFTPAQGDCNDCDAAVAPGAYDFPGNGLDGDCSGKADDEPTTCDTGLRVAGDDPMDAARSLGLCRMQSGRGWGVVAARWVLADGTSTGIVANVEHGVRCTARGMGPNPQSRGIIPSFGPNVRPTQGTSMVAMSTGVAREGVNPAQRPADGTSPYDAAMCAASKTPDGFPKDSPDCPGVKTAQDHAALDTMALELEIKTPTNAQAFAFDFNFYTFEWPQFVCSAFNDFFVALLKSAHPSVPADENISFDSKKNSVSVNNGFVEVCDPAVGATRPGGREFSCARGTSELAGTGFDGVGGGSEPGNVVKSSHAATGWLRTTSAVQPGETIRLRFAIWDMSDEALDSTVLIDHFVWDLKPATIPKTERVPEVK